MDAYEYTPLDESKSEIRFLILLPGKRASPLKGILATAPLEEDCVPDFEALSYVWGSSEITSSIALKTADDKEVDKFVWQEGTRRNRTISRMAHIFDRFKSRIASSEARTLGITHNLAVALPYLRYRDWPRVLWIDAICVNQKDTDERGKQVQRMAQIFSWASRVVGWLGEGDSVAIDVLKWVTSNVEYDVKTTRLFSLSDRPKEAHWADHSIPINISKDEFLSLTKFFQVEWFYRLWIVQEIHCADQSTSILQLGDNFIAWKTFCSAVGSLGQKRIETDDLVPETEYTAYNFAQHQVSDLTQDLSPGVHSLNDILFLTQQNRCEDPKDRIFGILSICAKSELDISPDYSKPVERVYQEAARDNFARSELLDLLTQCELNPKRMMQLPSWVPDFSCPSARSLPLSIPACTLESIKDHDNQLLSSGVRICTITSLRETEFRDRTPEFQRYRELIHLLRDIDLNCTYRGGESLLNAVARALIANKFSEAYYPVSSHVSKSVIGGFATELSRLQMDKDYLPLDVFRYHCESMTEAIGRSIFFSAEGFIGLAPRFAKDGDIVVSLVACERIMVLRPHGAGSGHYQVVGPAYCHGTQAGEHFLGSLPSDIDFVWHTEATCWAYRDRKTNEVSFDDPRLGDIPEGWRKEEYGDDPLHPKFVNEATGKKYDARYWDPRMLDTELEKTRGMVFEEFILV